MKPPRGRGDPIDAKRRRGWARAYAGYKTSVTEESITDWINQFEAGDHDLAARVVDCIDYYSVPRITAAFRELADVLDGWHIDMKKRSGQWKFCEYSGSAGTSGSAMIYRFRHAVGLAHSRYNDLFIYRSDILNQKLGAEDSLVLIDDFMCTGGQAAKSWDEFFEELVSGIGTVYLVTVAACREAVDKVSKETGLRVVSAHVLGQEENVFADACKHFDKDEKARLETYGARLDKDEPRGHGGCGLVIVFSHNCPNNTIPVLHRAKGSWQPLFPRQD